MKSFVKCSCVSHSFMSVFVSVFHDCILTIRFAGMGNLLKVLTREIENYPHFFLDFESKSGTGVEQSEKRGMGGVGVRCFLCRQVSAPDDEALKDSAYAPLLFAFFVFPGFSSFVRS